MVIDNRECISKCLSPVLVNVEEGTVETVVEQSEDPIGWTKHDLLFLATYFTVSILLFLILIGYFCFNTTFRNDIKSTNERRFMKSCIDTIDMSEFIFDIYSTTLDTIEDGLVMPCTCLKEIVMDALTSREEIIIHDVVPIICQKYGFFYSQ